MVSLFMHGGIMDKKECSLIDYFRITAVVLVVAIQPSPLDFYLVKGRYDAMLIMLSVVMFLLFSSLIKITGKIIIKYKDISLLIYLFHPLMIIVIRLFSKLLKINLLIDNSLTQFIAVIGSILLLSYLIMKKGEKYGQYFHKSQLG